MDKLIDEKATTIAALVLRVAELEALLQAAVDDDAEWLDTARAALAKVAS